MSQEFIIIDNTIKYANARNPVEERLIYSGDELWSRKFELAKKYSSVESASIDAKAFNAILPVKLLMLEAVPNGFRVAEVPIPTT